MLLNARAVSDDIDAEIQVYEDAAKKIPKRWKLAREWALRWENAGKPTDGDVCTTLFATFAQARYPQLDLREVALLLSSISKYEYQTGIRLTEEAEDIAAGLAEGWQGSPTGLIESAITLVLRRASGN
jgi:hypothetical protein